MLCFGPFWDSISVLAGVHTFEDTSVQNAKARPYEEDSTRQQNMETVCLADP